MMLLRIEPKEFDLNKKFPNVLLIGNGALKVCASASGTKSPDWSGYIKRISQQTVGEELKKRQTHYWPQFLRPVKMNVGERSI